jgi:hypothetical protein
MSCIDRRHFPVQVTPSDKKPEGYGLMGVGPSSGSLVLETLNSSAGDTPLDNIFRQNTSNSNFITLLLSRPNDTEEAYTGEMTINEVLPLFQNLSSQPKVPVSIFSPQLVAAHAQHFAVLLDADGIIGPDGNPIPVTSNASLAPPHPSDQSQVIFDTGDNMPQVPR